MSSWGVLYEWSSLLLASILASIAVAGKGVMAIPAQPLGYASGVLLGALLGYVLHEAAHRWIAFRYGCRARFTLWIPGLLVTLVFAVLRLMGLGFALIVPGYVAVYCPYPVRNTYPVAAAGPAVNIALGYLGLLAYTTTGLILPLGLSVVNGWLAVMNLLPIPPLDGYRVAISRPLLWVILFAAAAPLLLATGGF